MKTKSDEDIPDSKQSTDLQDLLISLNFKAINFERFSAPFSPTYLSLLQYDSILLLVYQSGKKNYVMEC